MLISTAKKPKDAERRRGGEREENQTATRKNRARNVFLCPRRREGKRKEPKRKEGGDRVGQRWLFPGERGQARKETLGEEKKRGEGTPPAWTLFISSSRSRRGEEHAKGKEGGRGGGGVDESRCSISRFVRQERRNEEAVMYRLSANGV